MPHLLYQFTKLSGKIVKGWRFDENNLIKSESKDLRWNSIIDCIPQRMQRTAETHLRDMFMHLSLVCSCVLHVIFLLLMLSNIHYLIAIISH